MLDVISAALAITVVGLAGVLLYGSSRDANGGGPGSPSWLDGDDGDGGD